MTFTLTSSSRLLWNSVLKYSSQLLTSTHLRYTSFKHHPMMLMDLPRIVYPNLFFTIRNFLSRILISGYLDPTFAMKSFSDGAKQAVTVVSHLIANDQFDDLHGFVTRKVEYKIF